MNQELLRIVDGMARDKNIDRDSILVDIEVAMASAARKRFGAEEDIEVKIDRETGEINAFLNGDQIDVRKLGRIPAQTAKQVMIQKLREDERGSIFAEYQERLGEVATGTVARFEGGVTIVNLGRTEALLPRSEQIPGETHHPGERVRAMILEVKEVPSQVKIILTRTHPDFILRLFEQEVPEVSEHVIEIRSMAREAGYRSKVAVMSIDNKVDAVGACVGVRGSRIKNIVDELGGEKIDIVRWNESSQVLIGNALRPAEVREIALCFELNRATVVVSEDQLSLAIGKRGQNVRLAARLTNWDVDILTPHEYSKSMEVLIDALRQVDGVDDTLIDKVVALGIVSVLDLEEVGPEPLVESLGLEEELAVKMVKKASEEARHQAALKDEQASAAQAILAEETGKNKKTTDLVKAGEEEEEMETTEVAEAEAQNPDSDSIMDDSAADNEEAKNDAS
jgi:N utilization substance protein A